MSDFLYNVPYIGKTLLDATKAAGGVPDNSYMLNGRLVRDTPGGAVVEARTGRPINAATGAPIAIKGKPQAELIRAGIEAVPTAKAERQTNTRYNPLRDYENNPEEFMRQVNRELGTTTRLSGSAAAPDGSAATGTQLSMRQPSPEEMLSFLGGAQNLAMYGRAAGDLVPGMGVRAADVPLSRLANEDDMEDMLYGGKTPEEINALQRGEALDEVVIDSDYELSPAEKGQRSSEDIKKMVKERNALRKAERPKTEAAKPQERRTVNGKTDYMQPVVDAETMRRRAFLDAPDIMQGLKNREMQSGYMTVGGQTKAITPEFLKSGSAEDLGAELSREERDELKAAERASTTQTFLEDKLKNVIAPSATAQNPMLGAGEGIDATDGKTTKYMDVSTANFVENMATPAEMNKEFDPFGYDPESERYAQNYFG